MKRNVKRIAAALLVAMLALCLTACGGGKNNEVSTVEITDAAEVLNTVWAAFDEDYKFPVGGGDSENMSMEGPAAFDISKADELEYQVCFPAAMAEKIDGAATMLHMMNANTFTAGAYHLTDAADMKDVAEAVKERTVNNQWMCGFPETLIIVQVSDDYMVSAYGAGDLVDVFKAELLEAYEGATAVLVEESLM